MSFIELQQAGLVGAQRIFVNVEAIAYVQEVHPELGLVWSSPAGPSRALVHLRGLPAPLAVLDSPEEVAARVSEALALRSAPAAAAAPARGKRSRPSAPKSATE